MSEANLNHWPPGRTDLSGAYLDRVEYLLGEEALEADLLLQVFHVGLFLQSILLHVLEDASTQNRTDYITFKITLKQVVNRSNVNYVRE